MATRPVVQPAVRPRPDRRPPASAETGSATTASRAVRPRVVVPNARLPTNEFGEAFLVWRCLDCGTTGSLDALPGSCPGCGTGRESLYYYTED